MSHIRPRYIFIVGNWKSGTTLLMHLLAKSPKVQCPFIFDGTEFWNKYFPMFFDREDDVIPEQLYRPKLNDIRKEIAMMYDNHSNYMLFKRPQFLLNIKLIREISNDAIILGTRRKLLPNIYSMLRMRAENNYSNSTYVGLYLPGWKHLSRRPILEQLVWQYAFANLILERSKIPIIEYEDLCDNTVGSVKMIEDIIQDDLNIEIPHLKNLNCEYKTGTSLKSWNEMTKRGILSQYPEQVIEFPPLAKPAINRILKLYEHIREELKHEL